MALNGKGACKVRYIERNRVRAVTYKGKDADTFLTGIERNELKASKGCCELCGSTANLRIDHCHTSGKVRGVLCHRCNTGLGMFLDSPELLAKAIAYLG